MSKKEKRNYIELLDEDGWHLVPDVSCDSSTNKCYFSKKILLFILLSILFVPIFGFTYSSYVSSANTDGEVKVATWKFQINSSTTKLGIDLADTIIENNFSTTEVIPGTEGKIVLEVDFSTTKVATQYQIQLDSSETFVPSHLKFYSDSAMTEEFIGFSGEIPLQDIDQPILKTIYWKWDYTDDDETVEWSNQEITLGLLVIASQKLD